MKDEQAVFLTFDDGPIPMVTDFVLSELRKFDAKATFFCIGNNVEEHPEVLTKVLSEGHTIGNHTFNHISGWENGNAEYFKDFEKCEATLLKKGIDSKLFRPPYGKISSAQSKQIIDKGYQIVMWNVLTADFDTSISPEKCLQNAIKNIRPGSIVIFHDSEKAFPNLKYALPKTLGFIQSKGWKCKALPSKYMM